MDRRRFIGYSVAAAVAASLPYGRTWAAKITGDVAAIRSGGGATTLAASDLQQLKDSLRGPLLLPGDPGYDVARHVRNQSIDKHPALIIQPSGAADVRTAVDFAREKDLLLAVKCGGHSYAGKSTCEGGMQIDLSSMRGVRVDPASRRAWVAGGSLLGELDHETMSLGLVTTAGTVSHTGVGGLTLGRGFGRLARRFGLALDNVKSVDIVNADGQLRHASAEENQDLYWAVRGGGGNFGVVTAFEFGLHPMQRQVIGGAMIFPLRPRARVADRLLRHQPVRSGRPVRRRHHDDPARRQARRLHRRHLLLGACRPGGQGLGAAAQARQADRGQGRARRLYGPAAQRRHVGSARRRELPQVRVHRRIPGETRRHHCRRIRRAPGPQHDGVSSSPPAARLAGCRRMPPRFRIAVP